MTLLRVRPKALEPIVKPVEDKDYLAWLRTQPCIVWEHPAARSSFYGPVQAAHGGADTGKAMGRKGSDHAAVSLCRWHHLDAPHPEALDGAKQADWERFHGLDLAKIRADLRRRYLEETT